MRTSTLITAIACSIAIGLFAVHPVRAEDVTGCPLGLNKGASWLVFRTGYTSADRAYWNDDPAEDPEMTDLPDGWHARISQTTFRVGYGITDRLDVGMLLAYCDKDVKKQVWKQQQGEWVKKWNAFRAYGFGDIWFAAKYKLIADRDPVEALAVGLGLKLDAADDPLVTKGIGTGSKDFRIVLLSHLSHGRFHSCHHIFYEFRGEVRGIEVKNEQGQMVPWEKSGWNLGDKFNYKFNFEYNLNRAGTFQAHLGLVGWLQFESEDRDGNKVLDSDRYEHCLFPKIVYLPEGEKYEHRKIFLGFKVPLSAKKDFSATFEPKLTVMWTFSGG